MNEGFTVFLERKIVKSLQASPERGRACHGLHAQIGLNDLQKSVDRYGADHPHTCLCPRLTGIVRQTTVDEQVEYGYEFQFSSFSLMIVFPLDMCLSPHRIRMMLSRVFHTRRVSTS